MSRENKNVPRYNSFLAMYMNCSQFPKFFFQNNDVLPAFSDINTAKMTSEVAPTQETQELQIVPVLGEGTLKRKRKGDKATLPEHPSSMVTFKKMLDSNKRLLTERVGVMEHINATPFAALINAYLEGRMSKARKRDPDVYYLAKLYSIEKECFRCANGYSRPSVGDVERILGITQCGREDVTSFSKGRKHDISQCPCRIIYDYFWEPKRVSKRDVETAVTEALQKEDRQVADEQAACLIILHLLITALLAPSKNTAPWALIRMCSSIESLQKYNWALIIRNVLLHNVHKSVQRTQATEKQGQIPGCTPLLLVILPFLHHIYVFFPASVLNILVRLITFYVVVLPNAVLDMRALERNLSTNPQRRACGSLGSQIRPEGGSQ